MLKPREIASLPEGLHYDSPYLYFRVNGASRAWVMRYPRNANGKKREEGLGPVAKVSLKFAREKRDERLKQLANGIDPIEEKRKAKEAEVKRKTFTQVAELVIKSKRDGWRTSFEGRSSTLAQWQRDLVTRCQPIANKGIDEIDVAAIKAILEPLWQEGHLDAAKSLLGRLEQVFNYAIGEEWRTNANPAAWKAFQHRWPARKAGEDSHHAALPIADAPAFLHRLRASDAMAARVVEFILLTAVRSCEARGAQWSEIDFDKRTWTIPKERMKKNREHIVPLSEPAVALLRRIETEKTSNFVFVGRRGVGARVDGKPMCNASLWAFVKRAVGDVEATTHGFRSTFRDWCGEQGVDREVAERCLAHSLGNEAEQAYARSQLIERRRPIMEAWGAFVDGARDNVLPFQKLVA
jgi:integrase